MRKFREMSAVYWNEMQENEASFQLIIVQERVSLDAHRRSIQQRAIHWPLMLMTNRNWSLVKYWLFLLLLLVSTSSLHDIYNNYCNKGNPLRTSSLAIRKNEKRWCKNSGSKYIALKTVTENHLMSPSAFLWSKPVKNSFPGSFELPQTHCLTLLVFNNNRNSVHKIFT